jgi:murein DD-endopeptidase MepM/ murein hydrolase activator NlpD
MRKMMVLIVLMAVAPALIAAPAKAQQPLSHVVEPGDTWSALSMRFGVEQNRLKALNPHFNTSRQPAIGATISLPGGASEHFGRLVRDGSPSIIAVALENNVPLWSLAHNNDLESPYRPTFFRPLIVPAESTIRDLPPSITTLEVSSSPALPGIALGIRGTFQAKVLDLSGHLDGLSLAFAAENNRFVGVVGTGAFFAGGEPELMIKSGEVPAWVQPWQFAEREWIYQELTLSGEAAQIDQKARDEERVRLRELWSQITPEPLWQGQFITPVATYLEVSAGYGARRSYNGGPYLTYHEGVDYSAYGGTPVTASAAGKVILAEPLYVRGGTVIIDHGLGIFTGYYHLSAIHAVSGQTVQPGDVLGEVGTTGLSTGNHLHWDLLINGIWVDAVAWQEQRMDCWLLEGLGRPCGTETPPG